jgi:Family of unknown function (DUF6498)
VNPPWQCPRCHIAYAKYRPGAAPTAARLVADGREMAAEARSDRSLLALLAANLAALAVAYATGMSLRELMLVYWIQSVIIGVSSFLRILNLNRFDTANFRINDQPVAETVASKRKVAGFFLLHYGIFHAVYFGFVAFDARGTLGSPGPYFLCALVFALNHGYSLVHNIRRDAAGRPNIGTLMFLPYARILPMHLTILFGAHLSGGVGTFFLFGALKVFADVVMHTVEHHVLNKGKE